VSAYHLPHSRYDFVRLGFHVGEVLLLKFIASWRLGEMSVVGRDPKPGLIRFVLHDVSLAIPERRIEVFVGTGIAR